MYSWSIRKFSFILKKIYKIIKKKKTSIHILRNSNFRCVCVRACVRACVNVRVCLCHNQGCHVGDILHRFCEVVASLINASTLLLVPSNSASSSNFVFILLAFFSTVSNSWLFGIADINHGSWVSACHEMISSLKIADK